MTFNPSNKENIQDNSCPQSTIMPKNYMCIRSHCALIAYARRFHCALEMNYCMCSRITCARIVLCSKILCAQIASCPILHSVQKLHLPEDCIVACTWEFMPETALRLKIACARIVLCLRLHYALKIACSQRLHYRMSPRLHSAQSLHVPELYCARELHVPA